MQVCHTLTSYYLRKKQPTARLLRDVNWQRGLDLNQLPHYPLLTLAVGGNNGGDHSHTGFLIRFKVDYVRVYQCALQE
jgi:hypothetical protein